MLDIWCKETADRSPLYPVGAFRREKIPEGVYGMIGALLLRSASIGDEIQDELRHLHFPLPDSPFRIVLFSLEDTQITVLTGKDRHNCRLNVYYAVMEHLCCQLEDSCNGFLVLHMGYMIGLLYPGASDNIPDACRDVVEYSCDTLGFSLHADVSMPRSGIDSIESAFQMVENFERSRSFFTDMSAPVFEMTESSLERIRDTTQRTDFEQTFFKTVDQICGAIRAKDAKAAEQYLRAQLLKITENCLGLPYPNTLNMTVNRFINLLHSRLVGQDLANWRYVSQMDFSRDLISAKNLQEFLDVSRKIAEVLVTHSRERTSARYDSMMHDIYAYIEENATDVNMGLTLIARTFKLKPRETAESFRQYFGESVNDVMHRARVRKAKELLLTTDRSVQEIAEEVGYCSLATMYRAFSNIEGIAPGKLRQSK